MPKKGKKQARSAAIKSKEDSNEDSGGDLPAAAKKANGRRGLVNLGNTCYLNSMLQCLFVSKLFSDRLLKLSEEGLGGMGAALCSVFQGLQGQVGEKLKGGAFSPKQLFSQICSKFPWYKCKEQQDAHELLLTLLGSVADEPTATEKKSKKEHRVPNAPCGDAEKLVWQSFRGHTCAAVVCWKCHRVSVRVDPFLDLSLELPIPKEEQAGLLGLPPRIAQLEVGGSSSSSGRASPKDKVDCEEPKLESTASSAQPKGVPFFMRPSVATWFQPLRQPPSSKDFSAAVDTEGAKVAIDQQDAEAVDEPEPFTFEVQLQKQGKKKDPRWGFGWCNESLQQKRLRVASVNPDTVLDRWNLKKRTMGEEELAVRKGDEVVAVGGVESFVEMQQLLRGDAVKLTLRRQSSDALACSGKGPGTAAVTESDAEDEEVAKQTAQNFKQAALDCHASMVEDLQTVFSHPLMSKVNGTCHLRDCFLRFTSSEAVEDDARPVYQCSECAKAQQGDKEKKALPRSFASRRVWLCQPLPPLLTVHMKRFRRNGTKFEKNNKPVTLPAVLDLSDFLLTEETCRRLRPHLASDCKEPSCKAEEDAQFELYGICVHQGTSLQRGHYVAYVNAGPSLAEEKWYGASDMNVWSCSRKEVLEAQGYVAFYRKIEAGKPSFEKVEEAEPSETVEDSGRAETEGDSAPEGSSVQDDVGA